MLRYVGQPGSGPLTSNVRPQDEPPIFATGNQLNPSTSQHMATNQFIASTEHNELVGSVAADGAHFSSMEHWLEEQALTKAGEHLVGVRLFVGQLPASGETFVQVAFLVVPDETDLRIRIPGVHERPTIAVRRIEREFSLGDFFRFFKSVDLTLSYGGKFEGRSYTNIS
jgi:hypothetical protein